MIKCCGTCAHLRNHGCKRPDHCVSHGYCDHKTGRVIPWEVCTCGGEFVKVRGWWVSDTMRKTQLVCQGCGSTRLYTEDAGEIKAPA